MALRPVFVPSPEFRGLVEERPVEFVWVPGMAPSQKKKSIASLHAAAGQEGLTPLLEISSKSESELGRALSAFRLKSSLPDGRIVPLESAFQGSKIFEHGGPYFDLYEANPREAKRDSRLRDSGRVVGFRLLIIDAPSEPRTLFYDWLYVRALAHRDDDLSALNDYSGFTDIEFNPKKSVNCQARACALFVALKRLGMTEIASRSPDDLAELVLAAGRSDTIGGSLF